MDRRNFLAASAAGIGSVFLAPQPRSIAAGEKLPNAAAAAGHALADHAIIDTHQHLWDPKTMSPPWLAEAPEILRNTYGLTEYAKATDGLNVVQAVYMEVDVAPQDQQAEADLLLKICREGKGPTRTAVISGRPDSAEFAAYIRPLAKAPEIKGVRQVLHVDSTPAGYCLRPQFVKSVQLLGELGLSYDLCMRPGELADGAALAKKCPGTRFVVDHCGNASPAAFLPESLRKEKPEHEVDQWKRDIAALSGCDNVICKISGIIASAPKGIAFTESLAPIVNFCLDRFGPDRVVFGGDWPVCLIGGTFKDWVLALRQIVADRPAGDQAKLFSENAKRFYRLPA